MSAVTIPDVKANVERTDTDSAAALADAARAADTRTEVLERINDNRS
jgi:hypothetical protein